MKLSTKGRYAVMALVDLAAASSGRPVTLADIADRQEISLSYLEQLFAKLRGVADWSAPFADRAAATGSRIARRPPGYPTSSWRSTSRSAPRDVRQASRSDAAATRAGA
jgi:hypothetical protein